MAGSELNDPRGLRNELQTTRISLFLLWRLNSVRSDRYISSPASIGAKFNATPSNALHGAKDSSSFIFVLSAHVLEETTQTIQFCEAEKIYITENLSYGVQLCTHA